MSHVDGVVTRSRVHSQPGHNQPFPIPHRGTVKSTIHEKDFQEKVNCQLDKSNQDTTNFQKYMTTENSTMSTSSQFNQPENLHDQCNDNEQKELTIEDFNEATPQKWLNMFNNLNKML